jgi:hypothetical protein
MSATNSQFGCSALFSTGRLSRQPSIRLLRDRLRSPRSALWEEYRLVSPWPAPFGPRSLLSEQVIPGRTGGCCCVVGGWPLTSGSVDHELQYPTDINHNFKTTLTQNLRWIQLTSPTSSPVFSSGRGEVVLLQTPLTDVTARPCVPLL